MELSADTKIITKSKPNEGRKANSVTKRDVAMQEISSQREKEVQGVLEKNENAEEVLLNVLIKNMTSNGLSLRFDGNYTYLLPDGYWESQPNSPVEEDMKYKMERADVLDSCNCSLKIEDSQSGVFQKNSGELLYEPLLPITIGNTTTIVCLSDDISNGIGFLVGNLNHDVFEKAGGAVNEAPKKRNEQVPSKTDFITGMKISWDDHVHMIERKLNYSMDMFYFRQIALAQLQEHNSKIERFKASQEQTVRDVNVEQHFKDHAQKCAQGYAIELSNIKRFIDALKNGDKRVAIKFGVTGQKYGSYSVRLKMSLKPS